MRVKTDQVKSTHKLKNNFSKKQVCENKDIKLSFITIYCFQNLTDTLLSSGISITTRDLR